MRYRNGIIGFVVGGIMGASVIEFINPGPGAAFMIGFICGSAGFWAGFNA